MNIEQMKAAISGMPIPKLVEMYPAATADQKFLILGEIDSQKKMMAEQAANNTPEGSVEQDIMQEATGIAAAQNMMNRPVSEMEMASRFAGIPSQLPENQPEISPEQLMAMGGVASLDAGRMDLAEGGIIAFQEGGLTIPSYATTDIRSGLLPERPTGFDMSFGSMLGGPRSSFDPTGNKQQDFLRLSELEKKRLGIGFNQEPFTASDLIEYERLKSKYQGEGKRGVLEAPTEEKVPEVKSPALKDIDATSEIDKDLADKTKEVESMSIFDQVKAPDIDSLYEQEDLTGVAEREAERYKEMLGEDEVTKEARDRLAKRQERIAEREGALSGEALATAGFKMMQSKSPFFLQAAGEAGQEGLKAFTEGKREINKLKDASDQLSMDINKIERAEKTAATKFGLESEERRRLANEKTNLMKNKAKLDMYNTEINTKLAERKIDALEKSYAASGASAKARMAETIRKAKQSVLESIPYQNEVTQINKKYKGRENSPEYQLELDRAYKKYLAMALPDEVYTAGDAYADVKSQFDTTAEQALAADI